MRAKYLLFFLKFSSIIALTSLTSCGLLYRGPSARDLLDQLGIDEEYFSGLPTCEQVRLYSYLSPYFPGVHSIEARPFGYPWMTEIFYNKGQVVAPCILEEANERLSNNKEAMNKWRVLGLNILIENMQFDYLASGGRKGADFNSPEAQAYLNEAVCSPTASFQPEATRALYMSRLRSFPHEDLATEAFTTQGVEKMKNMLCK